VSGLTTQEFCSNTSQTQNKKPLKHLNLLEVRKGGKITLVKHLQKKLFCFDNPNADKSELK
jgi:hypothetical protein